MKKYNEIMYNILQINLKNKKIILLYEEVDSVIDTVFTLNKYKDIIYDRIVSNLGEFLFDRAYVIFDRDFEISEAVFPFGNLRVGIILIRTVDSDGKVRNAKKLLKLVIHELCHLTKKGFYREKKHQKIYIFFFDKLVEELTNKIFNETK